jgi:hypothetical protein
VGLTIGVTDDGIVGGEVQSSGGGRVEPQTMDLTQDRGLGLGAGGARRPDRQLGGVLGGLERGNQ